MAGSRYDVVVAGGGHNGLTAAAYLARAGRSVLVLERLGQTGGLAVSSEVFPGVPVRLSRYSYLVSLLPQQIIDDLGLAIELRSRRVASYTPAGDSGLLVDGTTPAAARPRSAPSPAAAATGRPGSVSTRPPGGWPGGCSRP
jgi:phytoene dehydrogenase-like protein